MTSAELVARLGLNTPPFSLDTKAIAWVEDTHAGLSNEEKVGQVLLPLMRNNASPDEIKAVAESGVGGVTRFAHASPAFIDSSTRILTSNSKLPLLMACDLEFDEISAVGGIGVGTRFPNQLAVAASGSVAAAEHMATVGAVEGRARGFNWSFTPVADINVNFLNPLVVTRSFGDNADRVAELATAYIKAMEARGMATSTKHFPGDGVDDRDQHTVPSKNSLGLDDWHESFGHVYKAAIEAGTRTIMAGHISLPAYLLSRGGDFAEAYLPATFSSALLQGLLRGELGFNGLVVSDASEMGGFAALGRRGDLVAACIEAGCDILLLNEPADFGRLMRALESGLLSQQRLDEASMRVLALKASLGLHTATAPQPEVPESTLSEHRRWAEEVSKSAITLVRDQHSVLPVSSQSHPRVLLAIQQNRRNIFRSLPDLEVAQMLTDEGFTVEIFGPEIEFDASNYDLFIYVVADEAKQGKIHLRVNWDQLLPGFPNYMSRHFHDVPSILLSFGSPYLTYDAPHCPIVINAYSPITSMQQAAVHAIVGRLPFAGLSPVNALAGVDDGELIAANAIRKGPSRTP